MFLHSSLFPLVSHPSVCSPPGPSPLCVQSPRPLTPLCAVPQASHPSVCNPPGLHPSVQCHGLLTLCVELLGPVKSLFCVQFLRTLTAAHRNSNLSLLCVQLNYFSFSICATGIFLPSTLLTAPQSSNCSTASSLPSLLYHFLLLWFYLLL